MTTRLVFVSEVRQGGRVVKLWAVQDHETGRFLYGPAPYADCVSWRRGRGEGTVSLHEGDCLEVLATLDEASVDAVVTDPPYHMVSVRRRFGADGAAEPAEGVYRRSAAGFMGQTWDGGDLSFRPETWLAMFRVLKPGAYLLAMGATRGWHRTACAIEDAGFEIRDSLAWLYGSGFPKSHNYPPSWPRYKHPDWYREAMGLPNAPCTDGHPAGPLGTALKPSWEPVVVARKPLDGSHEANYEKHGTGYLNIDAARVPLNGDTVPEFEHNPGRAPGLPGESAKVPWSSRVVGRRGGDAAAYAASKDRWRKGQGNATSSFGLERGGERKLKATARPPKEDSGLFNTGTATFESSDEGRWPANVAHDGSDAVLGEFPETTSGSIGAGQYEGGSSIFGMSGTVGRDYDAHTGSAARFFYTAKPSRTEKEAGLAGEGTLLRDRNGRYEGSPGVYNRDSEEHRRNIHPTCKPLELFRWLIRLAVPAGGLVLDPFAGSGTTAIAAVLEGRRWLAIEREPEYAAIARARIEWWSRATARKPGRTVAEILGEVSLPRKRKPEPGPEQGLLL